MLTADPWESNSRRPSLKAVIFKREPRSMSIESREDAMRLAQQMVDRDAEITALVKKLQTDDMSGLECGGTVRLERLSAENAADARILAHWFLAHPVVHPAPLVRPQISLTLVRPDGPGASAHIGGSRVTPVQLEAAEELLFTMKTGERQLPKDLYEMVARAFSTTRSDAKARLQLAIYGGKGAPETPPVEDPRSGG